MVPVFDFWRDPDGAYLVMPLMAGGSLEKTDTRAWDTARVIRTVEQLTSGLAHAHRLGFVHADLHPGNVLFDAEGNAYLSDFGLARNLSTGTSTPPKAFASPEQARGEAPGPATDVYGLGRLAYRVLAGADPSSAPLPGVRSVRPDVRPAVDTVLRRATDPDPARRHPDAAGFLEDFRLALGEEPVAVAQPRNPYKGLRAFAEADAPDFFGREGLVEELAGAVAAHRLVAVVGPSGCGKSSLVRAGLIPALRAGRLPGSDRWLFATLYPGADPFAALAEALRSVAVEAVPDFLDAGAAGEVVGTVHRVLPHGGELMLVIDQFEELFTLCPEEHKRARFMDALLDLSGDPDARTRVILTLRADHYGRPLEYRPFGDVLRGAVVAITPPGPQQLTRAIIAPAAAVGVRVEPELAADIVGDAAAEPGGLPLMQHALTRLFEERSDARLTTAAYRRLGGLTEALAEWPESLFAALDPDGRTACGQLFLRLVAVDENGRETRARVALPELHALGIPRPTVEAVLEAFVTSRLLTFDRDPLSRVPTVELAHEALLEHWSRLRTWVEERRESLIMRRRLGVALADWESAGRNEEYLLHGGRLRQFESWSRESDLAVSEAEREYLRASRAREEAAGASRRRRRTLLAAALGALAVAAAVLGVIALVQKSRADDQRQIAEEQAAVAAAEADRAEEQAALATTEQQRAEDQAAVADEQASIAEDERERAEEQERLARARGLAAAAAAQVDLDPELAVMLAVEAVETTREADGSVLREAEEALHAAVTANRLVSTVPAEMWARTVAYSPDGSRFYLGGMTRGQVVATPSGAVEEEFLVGSISEGTTADIAVLAVAGADDELLLVAHYTPGDITVLDAASLEELYTLEGGSTWITDLDVSADGIIVAGIEPYDGLLFVWDLRDRARITDLVLDCSAGCPGGVALGDDGAVVTSGDTVWDVATGEVLLSGVGSPASRDVEMLDGSRMVVAGGSDALIVDLQTGETRQTLRGHSADIRAIDVAADGRVIATGGGDGSIRLWKVTDAEVEPWLILPGHPGMVWEVQFSPDGQYLTSVAGRQQYPDPDLVYTWPTDWEARTWDVSAAGSREWLTCAARESQAAFGPTGGQVVVAGGQHGAGVWDVASRSRVVSFGGWAETAEITAVAHAPTGTAVALGGVLPADEEAGGSPTGWVAVFDAATGEMTAELVSPTAGIAPQELAFSDDGSSLALAALGLARAWDTATWEVRGTLSESSGAMDYLSVAFHPGGELLSLQSTYDPSVGFTTGELWDLEADRSVSVGTVMHLPRDGRGAVAVSPDGRLVVFGGDGRPEVLEPFTERVLARLEAAPAYAVAVAFSPDGTRLATGESDGTVRLWDAATGQEQLTLVGHSAQVVDVSFSPDGDHLASVALDGTMRVWALDLDDLLALARSRVKREFTDAECRAYIGVGCPPAEAPERLIPATAEWGSPYGIDEATWEAAVAGGTWSERPYPPYLAGSSAVVLDPETGELAGVPPAPGIPDPSLPEGEEPWPATTGPLVYHPGLGLFVTTRADDGATVTYDPTAGAWSELVAPLAALNGRYGYGFAYDVESDRLVLFGGAEWGRTDEGKHVGLADTWVFDAGAGTWAEAAPPVSPPGRIDPGFVYDSQSDRLVLFGGHDRLGGSVLGDTWAYDTNTNTWTEMTPATSPPGRSNGAMWYDPGADLSFVFGGAADWSSWPPLPWMMLGGEELWGYDLEADRWTLYRADPNPGYRLTPTAVFDPESGEAILTGGDVYDADRRFTGMAADLWVYRHDAGS